MYSNQKSTDDESLLVCGTCKWILLITSCLAKSIFSFLSTNKMHVISAADCFPSVVIIYNLKIKHLVLKSHGVFLCLHSIQGPFKFRVRLNNSCSRY